MINREQAKRSVGKGWHSLIDEFYDEFPESKVVQVKEKYGSLRCYLTSGTDKMFELISEAEEQSYTICETCGNAGQLMATDNDHPCGWLKTLCFKCVETNEFYKKQLYAPVADEQQ